MSNPLLSPDKFTPASGPPAAWPGGRAPHGAPGQPGPGVPGGTYGAPGTLGGPGTGHGLPPAPPAADNVPGTAWPPPPPATDEPRLRRGGVASAAGVLIALLLVAGVVGWNAVTVTTTTGLDAEGRLVEQSSSSIPGWIWAALVAGLLLAVVSFVVPKIARITAPLYALSQGVVVGALSHAYEAEYDGIVLQAVGLTIGVFLLMLVLYATGRIRVTPRFRLGVIAATGGVMLVYLATFLLGIFGVDVPFIHDAGPIGIGISLVIVVIAALNLTLDFDFIDRAEQAGAPRHLEWFAALGLVVTLVWLYLEMLRLLAKLRE